MSTPNIPSRSAIRRLSKYLFYVRVQRDEERSWIRSREMAEALGLTSATVRRDLSYLDFQGTPKRGYRSDLLDDALTVFLGANARYNVVLIGAGNLGKALVAHRGFARHNFHIVRVYDQDPRIIGRKIGGVTVKDICDLARDSRDLNISFAILAVPADAAQSVATQLAELGVKGILNLSLAHISTPSQLNVVDMQIVAGLQELACVSRTQPDS